jgi:hypothetical protein
VDNWNNITNSQNRVRKKSFGETFCFSNCHIIRLDTGGLVFLVSVCVYIMILQKEPPSLMCVFMDTLFRIKN